VAALRGHAVRLVERGGRLGGSLFHASIVHAGNQHLLDYLIGEMRRLPVTWSWVARWRPGSAQMPTR